MTIAQASAGRRVMISSAPSNRFSARLLLAWPDEILRASVSGSTPGAKRRISSTPVMWIDASTSSGGMPLSIAHRVHAARIEGMVSTRTPSRSNTIARAAK